MMMPFVLLFIHTGLLERPAVVCVTQHFINPGADIVLESHPTLDGGHDPGGIPATAGF